MADTYLDDQLESSPPWLRQPLGAAWARAFGSQKDWLADIAKQAVKARFAGSATSRTNLLRYSQQLDNAAWGNGGCSVAADASIAPDGTLTADKIVEGTLTSTHFVNQATPSVVSAGSKVTFSVFLQSAGRTQAQVRFMAGGAFPVTVWFIADLTTGAPSLITGLDGYSIESVGGGWWRVSITATPTATGTVTASVFLVSGGTNTYVGDGVSGVYAWGLQLEQGSTATDYIKTSDAPASVSTPDANSAPSDALARIGEERGLRRGIVEAEADFRRRLVAAWEIWQWAGTPYGILRALQLAGYPSAMIQCQTGKQYQLGAGGTPDDLLITDMATPVHLGGLPAELWSDIAVMIVEPWPERWAGVAPADGSDEQKTVSSLLVQWKAGHNRVVKLQAQKGPVYGGAGLTFGGGAVYGSGTVTPWTPPAG